ncbi:hypothetical protein LCGC14_1080160 [marine sediment metagenome]|uniref:Glycine-rich domain-containing protein n=1 Tax=marine sediment metagenome TaxID=412755 RepID=A0A0F9QLB7_9ZZZZ
MNKKLFILMLCMVFLIGSVSALDFDSWNNKLTYSENDMKISLDNWWGFGKNIGTAKLKSHKSVDEKRLVKLGNSTLIWYEINFLELYSSGLGDVEITNVNTGEIIDRDYYFVYWGNETYQVPNYVCDNVLNKNGTIGNECYESGTKDKTREAWLPYNSRDIPKGKITIGLKLNMFMDETLDIVWKIGGKKIKKHAVVTSGAVETIDGDFTVLTYANNGTFNITFQLNTSVLVIGGGGSGGNGGAGGGGGAGEFDFVNSLVLSVGDYNIVVGDGGAAQSGVNTNGLNGSGSSFHTVIGLGGGGGGSFNNDDGEAGGSGGGGGAGGAGGSAGGTGLAGNDGGTGEDGPEGGGGGGADAVGGNAGGGNGDGGNGLTSSINGTSTTYAGGAGGGSNTGGIAGTGGTGGGGDGGLQGSSSPTAGIDGTGGGGGGTFGSGSAKGGDGIVIIRYKTSEANPAPTVNLDSPANNTNFTLTNIVVMNATIFDDTNITNVTLYLNNVGNETNSTSGLNNTVWNFTKNMGEGDTFWTLEACNFLGFCTNASQRLFNVNTTPDIQYGNGVPQNEANITVNFFEVNVTITEDLFKNITFDLYNRLSSLNQSVTFTNSSREKVWGNLLDGNYSYNVTVATITNQFNSTSTRNISIDSTNPNITLTGPPLIIGSHILNTNLTINWTFVESNPDICIIEYERVNVTVTCSDLTTEINTTNAVNRTIIIYMNDTFGNVDSDNRTWQYNFIETSSEFTVDVFETNNYTFAINVTTTQLVSSFTAFLNHNGTIHSADSTCTSGDCEISTIIDIPLLNPTQTTENKTFFWQLSIFNGTGTSQINTSTRTQNVTAINFERCGTTPQAVNFTIHREDTRDLLSSNFNGFFQSYLGTGDVKKESNFSGSGQSHYEFCIDQNETFIVNSQIDLSATDFSDRHYSFVKDEFTNVSIDRQLFLVNSSVASVIIIEVKDQGLIPLENIIVNISRFYPGIGQFIQIENQITDEFGQIVAKLVQNNAKYRFNFFNIDNVLLKTSDDLTIACRSLICIIPFVIEDTTNEFERFENLTIYTSTLTFDNTTNVFTFTWADQRGEFATTRLEVTRYLLNGSSVVCNVSSTSILSTLSCEVGDQSASYKAQSFRTTTEEDRRRISVLNVKVNDLTSIFGVEGLLWVLLLLFTMIGIGAFNPSVGAILYGAGFIIMGIIGVISMPPGVFFANTLLVILFVWAVNKR